MTTYDVPAVGLDSPELRANLDRMLDKSQP
jgi:hypothetical protein